MSTKKILRIGAHMSIAGGPEKALMRGQDIGCTTIQIFTRSNRRWSFDTFDEETAKKFKDTQKETAIDPVVCHASYLINLASQETETHKKSMLAMEAEIESCSQLGIPYVVLHPGSHKDAGMAQGIQSIARNLSNILSNTPDDVTVLLETMAGQGTAIGGHFEELALIREKINTPKRIGVCFDTCHAFAAGYHFSTEDSYQKMWESFDCTLGLEQLKVIHMNNSKKEFGSRADRHEHIADGKIPIKAFTLLMNDERFFEIPKILETPKNTTPDDDIRNMRELESHLNNESKKKLEIPSHTH